MGTENTGRSTYGKTPSLMSQLEIEYADGTRQIVGTHASWKVTDEGPIQEADLLMGEAYDARKEMTGWSSAGFDDDSWQFAILAKDNGNLTATFYQRRNPTKPGQGVKNPGRGNGVRFQASQTGSVSWCSCSCDRRNQATRDHPARTGDVHIQSWLELRGNDTTQG
ncbi:hypothetical protein K239x_21440 [Planctomycetes bacterium K23_9]|uniref:Bacterial alpha-L-rhamnosidase N-terminal domain-containing protein n=1 Tax=Stieleria marina TaxID=1930275 RepID=A0A517NSU6_9BACT|nr:hypothetical protein K239x_21440 [Planctomycetes bacterium K23_9]